MSEEFASKPETPRDYDTEWNWLMFGATFLGSFVVLLFGLSRVEELYESVPAYLAVVIALSIVFALLTTKFGRFGWDVVLGVLKWARWW